MASPHDSSHPHAHHGHHPHAHHGDHHRDHHGAHGADTPTALMDGLLAILAQQGWRCYPTASLASALGIAEPQLQACFPSPGSVITALNRYLNQAMLDGYAVVVGESVRDRLFDLIMRRFDAMLPYRPALVRLTRDWWCHPLLKASVLETTKGTIALMLRQAGGPTHGWQKSLAEAGLTLLYADTMRIWLKDDSSDQGQTMARLERNLERADGWAHKLLG
jgi:hypothetical protein